MFTTDITDEILSSSDRFFDSQIRTWKRFDTSQPYFQIVEQQYAGGDIEEVSVLISDPYELKRIIDRSRLMKRTVIGEVMISTPGSVNRTDTWLHETLLAMFYVSNRTTQPHRMVYITKDGMYGVESDLELRSFSKEIIYQSYEYPLNLFEDYFDSRRSR